MYNDKIDPAPDSQKNSFEECETLAPELIQVNNKDLEFSIEAVRRQLKQQISVSAGPEIKTDSKYKKVIELTENMIAVGIFIFRKERKVFVLSGLYYDGVREKLNNGGYFKRYTSPESSIFIRATGPIITEVSTEEMRDYLTQYVESFKEDIYFEYEGVSYQIYIEALRETFFKNSNNIFNRTWLEHMPIHKVPVLRDEKDKMYFLFRNKLVTVTKDGIIETEWAKVKGVCVWEKQLVKRDFKYIDKNQGSIFAQFLRNVTAKDDDRFIALCSAIGYMLHYYFIPSAGQVVVLYDEAITDSRNPQGGTGKGLIANSLKQMRCVVKIDGKHYDPNSRFRNEAIGPETQVAWFDDIKPDFDFSLLFSNTTDGWTVERKHEHQLIIAPEDSPKVLICSNSILKGGGASHIRRQFAYELSDYYSKKIVKGNEEPIKEEHGGLFFSDDWPEREWNEFYSFMTDCAMSYLSEGIVLQKSVNIELNRLKQATSDDFVEWCNEQNFVVDNSYETKVKYEDFKTVYYGEDAKFSQRGFTNWMKSYAQYRQWKMTIKKSNSVSYFEFVSK